MASTLDINVIRALYAAFSVSTPRTRQILRLARRPFVDPEGLEPASAAEVEETARWLIRRHRNRAAVGAAIAGLPGATGIPAEVMGRAASMVRLAQRLCVVYGFDPVSDRGEMALLRALSAGSETDLLVKGLVAPGIADLLAPGQPRSVGGSVARGVLQHGAAGVFSRRLRGIPVVAAWVTGREAFERSEAAGDRMVAVLSRLAELDAPGSIEDATEVPSWSASTGDSST